MSKIICDVCGTSYPETATQCPICGCVCPGNKTVSGDTDTATDRSVGTYTYVKGGRFSKANVRKRNQQNQLPAAERKDMNVSSPAKKKTEKGLVIAVIALLLAIVAVVIYIALRIFGPALPQNDSGNTGTTIGNQTSDTSNSDTADKFVPCTDIEITPEEMTLNEEGASWLLSVNVLPENTTDTLVVFTSEDETIATVDPDTGKVTAVAPGTTNIIITCGSVTKTCKVECAFETDEPVVEDPVYSTDDFKLNREDFTLTKSNPTHVLYKGEIPSDVITWTSDDESVATVVNGLVTAVGSGTTTVHAEYADIKLSCIVRCDVPANMNGTSDTNNSGNTDDGNTGNADDDEYVAPYQFEKNDVTLVVDEWFTLRLMDANETIMAMNWQVKDNSVCSVNGNRVTALSRGTTEVFADYDGVTYTCTVRVK